MSNIGKVGRSHALDGLRGMAACVVVFYHAILHNDDSLLDRVLYQPLQAIGSHRDFFTKLALICLNGEVSVFLFFVLSGCVLRRSLDGRNDEPVSSLCARFTAARLIRLYPPVIVCMFFFYALGKIGIQGYPAFTLHATLANAALRSTLMHGPSASVQAEVMAIPFILAVWLLQKRFGLVPLYLAFVYGILAIDVPPMTLGLPNMRVYLFAFMAGMLVAEPTLKAIIERIPTRTSWIALAGLVFCRTFSPHDAVSSLIAMVIAAALLVAVLLHGQRSSLMTILERPLAQALGRVSFSLYLLNVPVLYLIWAFTDRLAWPKTHALEAGLVVGVLSIALTWPLAWLSERWIERPSIAGARWVWSALRRPRDNESILQEGVAVE